MRDDFCVFILSHGRPDSVKTRDTLKRSGYTGETYIVIDDEDETGDEYRERYGDAVLEFSKDEVAKYTDQYDNFPGRGSPLWARNACWSLAEQVGCRYFVQLDDDYRAWMYRVAGRKPDEQLPQFHGWAIRNLDRVWEALVEFLIATPALTICMSQGGDHFGGAEGNTERRLTRKAMNSFVCTTDRLFMFAGRMNDDVNTYVALGNRGGLFFTYTGLQLDQEPTQSNPGGITELYLDAGTYVKSFYTVMAAPSCVKVRPMGRTERRLHHSVDWNAAVPKIVSDGPRKERKDLAAQIYNDGLPGDAPKMDPTPTSKEEPDGASSTSNSDPEPAASGDCDDTQDAK